MVHHIVLFKLKPHTTDGQRDQVLQAIRELKSKIPEVLFIDAGVNFSERGRAFDVMLVSHFQTKADLEIYMAHPEHQHVVQHFIAPLREDLIVGDLES